MLRVLFQEEVDIWQQEVAFWGFWLRLLPGLQTSD